MASTSDIESQRVKVDNLPLKERLEAMFQTIGPPLTSESCIFRIHKELRMIKESAYTPRVISIGPFHHNKDKFHVMEKQKVRYLHLYIQHRKVSLDMLLAEVRDSEKSVRQSYGEHIELNSDDFVMMVLLDGLFIIEFFRRAYYPQFLDQNDMMLYRPHLDNSIYRDLMLLENQLPFSVLESLYNLIFPIESRELPFLKISCNFFSYFNKQDITPQVKVLHFTDLIRMFHLHSSSGLQQPIDPPENNENISSYSANKLHEFGVTFRATSSKCLLDIQFTVNDGVLFIPQLKIYDHTESMFRNIMALEQHIMHVKQRHICDYVFLMSTLIDTGKDVELLARKGIISNKFAVHEEVAALFNNLNHEILNSDKYSCFSKLYQDLDKYCKKPRHKWRATLVREYVGSPWQIASVIAAAILLVLTFMQTLKAYMD